MALCTRDAAAAINLPSQPHHMVIRNLAHYISEAAAVTSLHLIALVNRTESMLSRYRREYELLGQTACRFLGARGLGAPHFWT